MHPYFVPKARYPRRVRKTCIALGVSLASACFVPSKEAHPDNVERDDIPTVASGACGTAPPVDPATYFSGPNVANAVKPPAGTELVFEGVPRGRGLCAQKGCSFECCDNACGSEKDCPYALSVDEYNHVCLTHPDFTCGGSDCSFFCKPFSDEPRRRYRFVGLVRYDEATRPILDVTRFCRAD